MNGKIDRRTVDRYMDKGIIKKADYDAYLKSLPDDTANATLVQMDVEETEITSRGTNGSHDSGQPEGT